MRLAARVTKLESVQVRVLRCAWCRFALHSRIASATGSDSEPPDVLPTKCWYCGTKFVVPLRGLNEQQREVVALIYNSHPTKQFTDERIQAAQIWFDLSLKHAQLKRYEQQTERENEPANQASWPHQSNNRTRPSLSPAEKNAKRDREHLKDRADKFREGQTERFKKLAGGPDTFPLDQKLEEIENEHPTSIYDEKITDQLQSLGFEKYSTAATDLRSRLALANIFLKALKKCEACEIVVWGHPLCESQEEIRLFEQRKQDEIDNALALGKPVTAS